MSVCADQLSEGRGKTLLKKLKQKWLSVMKENPYKM